MTNLAHGVKPSQLCSQHLNSCHGELHQENAYIKRYGHRHNHLGHIRFGQYIPELVEARHHELAHELDFRAKQSKSRGGHQSSIDPLASVDAELFGFPIEALKLYQRNVFRHKDCRCME